MKQINDLKNEHFIEIATIIDNNFTGNAKIIVFPMKMGIVRVIGHTEGKQCINCDVSIDVFMNKLNGIYTQNKDLEIPGPYRPIYPPTLKRIKDYLNENNFNIGV